MTYLWTGQNRDTDTELHAKFQGLLGEWADSFQVSDQEISMSRF